MFTPMTMLPADLALILRAPATWIATCSWLCLAGCTTPPLTPAKPVADTATSPSQSAVTQTVTPAEPPSLPPSAESSSVPTNDSSYGQRTDAMQLADQLAASQGLDPAWVKSVLGQARYKDSVARLIMPTAPGSVKNWSIYRSRFIDANRVKWGANFWRTYETDLLRAEARWGVSASIIAGVIGVETIYGRNTGNYRVLDALTTLSLDFPKGRSDRSAFFQKELGEFLKMAQEQRLEPTAVLGSYAGALGWSQFMPSSVRKYAVDFDGDGRIDLIRSPVDAIGSVASYLAAHGWRKDVPACYEVTPPADTQALAQLLAPDIRPTFTVEQMLSLGAQLQETALQHTGLLALVKLENGDADPTYVAGTENFYAITRYNQSSYYALAVVQLGQAVARSVR